MSVQTLSSGRFVTGAVPGRAQECVKSSFQRCYIVLPESVVEVIGNTFNSVRIPPNALARFFRGLGERDPFGCAKNSWWWVLVSGGVEHMAPLLGVTLAVSKCVTISHYRSFKYHFVLILLLLLLLHQGRYGYPNPHPHHHHHHHLWLEDVVLINLIVVVVVGAREHCILRASLL